jgi:hypothetical protein
LGITLLAWFLGTIMSIPSFIIYYCSFKGLNYFKCPFLLSKIILIILAILLMMSTFYLMFKETFYEPSLSNPYGWCQLC